MRASVIAGVSKPTAGFFSFGSCEGCQLQVLSLEDVLLDLLGAVEIVNFREAIDERRADRHGLLRLPGEGQRLRAAASGGSGGPQCKEQGDGGEADRNRERDDEQLRMHGGDYTHAG